MISFEGTFAVLLGIVVVGVVDCCSGTLAPSSLFTLSPGAFVPASSPLDEVGTGFGRSLCHLRIPSAPSRRPSGHVRVRIGQPPTGS